MTKTHGMRGTRTHNSWARMKQRAKGTNRIDQERYKNVGMCERWEKFENFFDDMGERPEGMSLDRKDNEGDYTPENCRWATREEQQSNTRSNVFIEHSGEVMTLAQWEQELNFSRSVITGRLHKGWSVDEALMTGIGEEREGLRLEEKGGGR